MDKKFTLKPATDEKGHDASPQLSPDVKNYLIDIDGTITDDVPNEDHERMKHVLPYDGSVETLNKWYDDGHIITFFTSRTEEVRQITEDWLDKHGYKYHGLLMGKPRGGNYHWVDNHIVKGTRYQGVWADLIEVNKKIQVFPT